MKKSLIKYPGGKTFALSQILPYFENYDEVFSPFFGGGSLELNLAEAGKRVYGCDIFQQLVNFWNFAINYPKAMYLLILKHYNYFHSECISVNEKRNMFYELKEICKKNKEGVKPAIDFFTVNRLSFSGMTLLGGFSAVQIESNFGIGILERLKNSCISNLSIECLSFQESFEKYGDKPIYADPPYLLKKGWLYGEDGSIHRDFDHKGLRDLLVHRDHWVLSYNNCAEIKELYRGYRMTEPKWRYGMGNKRDSNELLIFGHGVEL
jgi:DNA adenine methylase